MISEYRFTKQATKDLARLPTSVQKKIFSKLDYFIESSRLVEFAKKMVHHQLGEYRFRVSDYRTIFDVEGTYLRILTVGHRRGIYR